MGIKTPAPYRQMEYRWLLLQLAEFFKPETYVEIGVKNGYTFIEMLKYVGLGIGVDIDNSVAQRMPTEYSNWKFFHGTSREFADGWEGPIDFLFIDGDHKRDSVIDDFENLFKWVTEDRGLIFLHDTYPVKPELAMPGYCNDAWEAGRYLRERANGVHPLGLLYEMVTLPGPWAGLSIVRRLRRNPDDKHIAHGWMDRGSGVECGP